MFVRGSLVEAIVRENRKKREGERGDICFK